MELVIEFAGALLLVGFVLLLIEWASTLLMLGWTFKVGLAVVHRELQLSAQPAAIDGVSVPGIQLRSVGRGRWIFRHAYGFFDWHTPFPIRGVVESRQGRLEVVGRQPLGGFVFLLAWGLSSGPVLGALGAAAFYAVCWLLEQTRFERDLLRACTALGVQGLRGEAA